MLSIGAMGKAGGSAGEYYLNLAREDYYTGGGEPPGLWRGDAALRLGLTGRVNRQDLRALLSGANPETEKPLVQQAGHRHRAGWDLTFSAPKSLSVLWSQADPSVRKEIEAAQQAAVDRTLSFLEHHAAFTRRGRGSTRMEPVKGLTVATFEHSTSREQDPQLHTHCLVANAAPRRDGSWGSLESRFLYEWKMTAGAFYRAELAQKLQERLSLAIERDDRSFRITGIPRAIEEHFSKRREQIREELHHFAAKTAKSAAVATIQSREQKAAVNRQELFLKWQQEGQELGFGPEDARRFLEAPAKDIYLPALSPEAILQTLTQTASTFPERDMWRVIAEGSQGVTGAAGIAALAEQTRRHPEWVFLGPDARGTERYSTWEMVKLEQALVEDALIRRQEGRHPVSDRVLQAVLQSRTLSPEQTMAVRHLTQGADGVACVVGMAGTGKSYALDAARDIWAQAGFRVSGAALAGKAAQELEKASGIRSVTLHALLAELRSGERQLTKEDILVLDEAGMVGSRQMKELLGHAQEAGAKVALIGDFRQLQPIDAGGVFRLLAERLGAPMLTGIRRQREAWARETVHEFAAGKAAEALARYHERGLLMITEDRSAALSRMAEDFVADRNAHPEASILLLTDTRQECRQLNNAVRELLKAEGCLGAGIIVRTVHGLREFAAGDRILFTRNSRMWGVKNGTLGTVERIGLSNKGEPMLHIRLDDRRLTNIPSARYQAFDHGYALTTHKAQGVTVDRAYVVTGGPMADRELTYVQMSRHRDSARIYVDRPTADTLMNGATPEDAQSLQILGKILSRSHQKDTTEDYEHARKPEPSPREKDRGRDLGRDLGIDF